MVAIVFVLVMVSALFTGIGYLLNAGLRHLPRNLPYYGLYLPVVRSEKVPEKTQGI